MTFLEILQNEITTLPLTYTSEPFRDFIKSKIETFGDLIDNSENLSGPVDGIEFKPEIFKRWNKILRDGIIKAIDAYYEGNPSKAYASLSSAMKHSNVTGYLDKESNLNAGTNLYRIRVQGGNSPLTKNELFHIPFELRGKVQSQRYSIPGLPSLYLSNGLFVAWEEMKRPGFSDIQAVRICNKKDLYLLDLTTDIYNRNLFLKKNEAYGWQLLYKIMVWPLVAACSVKVLNQNDSFKPEYIIPQLLLQWVNKDKVSGIKYSSTHIDINRNNHEGFFYNIVLRVKTCDKDKGQCEHLLSLFKSTQVVPVQLRQFITQTDRLYGQESPGFNVNKEIHKIELITGVSQPYYQSIFGLMEHTLNVLDLEEW